MISYGTVKNETYTGIYGDPVSDGEASFVFHMAMGATPVNYSDYSVGDPSESEYGGENFVDAGPNAGASSNGASSSNSKASQTWEQQLTMVSNDTLMVGGVFTLGGLGLTGVGAMEDVSIFGLPIGVPTTIVGVGMTGVGAIAMAVGGIGISIAQHF